MLINSTYIYSLYTSEEKFFIKKNTANPLAKIEIVLYPHNNYIGKNV